MGEATLGISLISPIFQELGMLPEPHTSWKIVIRGPLSSWTNDLKNDFVIPSQLEFLSSTRCDDTNSSSSSLMSSSKLITTCCPTLPLMDWNNVACVYLISLARIYSWPRSFVKCWVQLSIITCEFIYYQVIIECCVPSTPWCVHSKRTGKWSDDAIPLYTHIVNTSGKNLSTCIIYMQSNQLHVYLNCVDWNLYPKSKVMHHTSKPLLQISPYKSLFMEHRSNYASK
jgi:hypothetical protein